MAFLTPYFFKPSEITPEVFLFNRTMAKCLDTYGQEN